MATQVDLRQLAVERGGGGSASAIRPRSRWLARYALPAALVVCFVVVLGWSLRDSFLPVTEVTVTPVVLTQAEVQATGTPLFQAAGWVEPRPTAVMVSSLVEGVVEELLVLEGQEVAAGQPVAKLVDADARIALSEAQANLRLREAELALADAALESAERSFEQPVHLEAAVAEAEAARAKLLTELRNLPFTVKAAKARVEIARQELEGKKQVADAIAGRLIQRAQSEYNAAAAALEELQNREESLQAELVALTANRDALERQLNLKTEEHRKLAEAKASQTVAQARVDQAKLNVESAELHLQRMTIRSPIDGRVLARNSHPGQRLSGMDAASERDSSTVVSLYDPQSLQVRADVRLEDVGKVQPGQPVQITTPFSSEPLTGQVLTATSQADIQKNTLQIKAAIGNPPAALRPEMLVQVTFLAPETGDDVAAADNVLRLMIPRQLVQSSSGSPRVWIADGEGQVARLVTVELGRGSTAELVEVTAGLNATDKLIVGGRESLTDGERIRVSVADRAAVAAANP